MKNIQTALIFLLMILFPIFMNAQSPTITKTVYRIDTLHTWAYDIRVNGKLYIRQTHLPAVQGVVSFNTKEDAEKLADLVVDKYIKTGQLPAITKQELINLGFTLP
ncbi:MAG: DUF4907 domain-containing protein [Bacteroidota bacterium]|nr:DUF4907 domain-containing protein [Bacteroidota bacterium]